MNEPVEDPTIVDQALTVRCPWCGALPGERCIPPAGLMIHAARVEHWKSIRLEAERLQ